MESFPTASATIETDIEPSRLELIDGLPSSDYNKRQIQLAVEKFRIEQPCAHLDKATLNEILLAWADSSDSKRFSTIARSPEFKNHPKFQGDVANITLEDMY